MRLEASALSNRLHKLDVRLAEKQRVLNEYEIRLTRLVGRINWLQQMIDYQAAKATYAEVQRTNSEFRAEAARMVAERERARAEYAWKRAELQKKKTKGAAVG